VASGIDLELVVLGLGEKIFILQGIRESLPQRRKVIRRHARRSAP
jgi:hypothetical protein